MDFSLRQECSLSTAEILQDLSDIARILIKIYQILIYQDLSGLLHLPQ